MKYLIRKLCVCVMFLGVPLPGLAGMQEAQTAYNQARDGKLEIAQALKVVTAEPDVGSSPVLLAYHGSLVTMSAADYWLPFRRLKYVNQGLDLLDQAASRTDPANQNYFEVMLIVAITNARVPGFLDRAEFAQRYFNQISLHPKFDRLPSDLKATVYAWQARLEGESSASFSKLKAKAIEANKAAAMSVLDEK